MLSRIAKTFFGKHPDKSVDMSPERIESIRSAPIENLTYLAEWGAPAWQRLPH